MSTTTGKIQYITDENNGIVLPVTHERGVVDSSGVNLQTKLAQKVDSADIDNVVELTQAQYDALSTKDSRTMYITTDSTVPSDHVGVASIVQTTTSSADGGTNVVTCTLTNNQTSTFQIKNGNQGNSGYTGAAGELEVVNNLTQGGATAALSAEMGKTLEGEISQLGLEVNGVNIDESWSALSPNPTTYTIPLSGIEGKTIKVKVYNTGTSASTIYVDSRDSSSNRIAYIIPSTSIAAGGGTDEVSYVVPSGMTSIRMACASGRSTYRITITCDDFGVVPQIEKLAATDVSGDLLYKSLITENTYVHHSGDIRNVTGACSVYKMPIFPGKGIKVTNVRGGNSTSIASYVFYDGSGIVLSHIELSSNVATLILNPTDIPSAARYISITLSSAISTFESVVSIYDLVEEVAQDSISNVVFNSLSALGEVSQNSYLLLGHIHCLKNTILSATISGILESVSVGVGYNEETSTAHPTHRGFNARWFNITPTKLNLYGHSSGEDFLVTSYDHGLTLGAETEIAVITLYNGSNFVYKVRLHDGMGNYYEQSISNWGMGRPFAQNLGTQSVDVSLRFMPMDIYSPVWLFGDSYVSFNSEERWPYYITNLGCYNYLLNARPGESPEEGWADLQTLINAGAKPKTLCWCLGMNGDGTESQEGGQYVINSYQKTYIDNVKALCESNGITPVFATIPTVPTLQKTGLSNYVRSLGCRYIDFAEAVGATSAGVWKTGMLSNDGVHPTALGAKALAMRVLVDFPDIAEGS